MTYFDKRLEEVHSYFANGDTHLGYRRLLDAAIETNNFDVYAATLRFCDWYDAQGEAAAEGPLLQQVVDLLTQIHNGYNEPVASGHWRLQATGISKRYAHGRFSLSPLDVTLAPAQIIGLVGENGNGKTTLLRVLNGELKPDTGHIRYHYSPQPPTTAYEVRSGLAFVPQRPQTWYGSLMDNLQYASSFTGYKGEQNRLWTEMIIARMGLRSFRSYSWSRISSGYKMRFELARVLITQPQVLLLDEPLANLDMLAQQIILEDLKFLAQSHSRPLSIILSSQQLYEVEKVSDEVIFLQQGTARRQYRPADAPVAPALTLELETSAPRSALQALFSEVSLRKLSFNGGVYILYFNAGTSFSEALQLLGSSGLSIKYVRDISASSRRFFDA